MGDGLRQDASKKIEGILYQYYTVLQFCYEMNEGDILYVEKYGDISFNGKNIEVKKYKQKLGDKHQNFWKTLYNWMTEQFDHTYYKNLALITTQEYTNNSSLKTFNEMSIDKRLECLKKIKDKYITNQNNKKKEEAATLNKYFDYCFDIENEKKLKEVVEKIYIFTNAPEPEDLVNSIISKYANNIEKDNQNNYINTLLGYVISPKEKGKSKWKISKADFDEKCRELTSVYISLKKVITPKIKECDINIESYSDYKFIQKINLIEYEEVTQEAVYEFVNAKHIISEDFQEVSYLLEEYNKYRNSQFKSYQRQYRRANRDANAANLINESKNFYDLIMDKSASKFMNFIDNDPKTLRNGTLHIIAEEDNDEKKLVWKLTGDTDE